MSSQVTIIVLDGITTITLTESQEHGSSKCRTNDSKLSFFFSDFAVMFLVCYCAVQLLATVNHLTIFSLGGLGRGCPVQIRTRTIFYISLYSHVPCHLVEGVVNSKAYGLPKWQKKKSVWRL